MLTVRARSGASADEHDDADLARRAIAGERDAFGELFERWFDRAFDVAWHIVHDRDAAADVAQEAFATAWQQIGTLRQPESFGGWILRIARNKGLNRLQRERRSVAVGDEEALVSLDERAGAPDPADPVVDQERDDMVWVAAAALGEDDASLLDLHLRFGLGPAELASELGVEPNAVHQRLFRLKQRLGDAIAAWTLWRRGGPACATLQGALASAQATGFDRATASTILGHARRCDECTENRRLHLSPEALFAATPLVAAGPFVRAEAAAALEATGVPATASTTGAGPGAHPRKDGAGDPPASSARRPGKRWRRGLTIAAATAGVLAVAVVGLAERLSDEPSGLVDQTSAPTSTPAGTTRETKPTSAPTTTTTPAGVLPATTDPPGPAQPPPEPEPPDVTTTVPEPAPAPGPVIGGFRASQGTSACSTPSQTPVVFVWSSTDATDALLGPTGGAANPVPPSGSTETCAIRGSQWTLVVTGAGGRATQQATVPP